MASKILSSMFRNMEFWSKWNFILGLWGVLFQVHLFIQNLVVSKYLKFCISDCESLARLYIRQMGMDTRDQDTILCSSLEISGKSEWAFPKFSWRIKESRWHRTVSGFLRSVMLKYTQHCEGWRTSQKEHFSSHNFSEKATFVQCNFSISFQFQVQATEIDIHSKMMKPLLFLESSSQPIYLYTAKHFHNLNLRSCQNKWTKYALWCFILYLFIFCIVCWTVCWFEKFSYLW